MANVGKYPAKSREAHVVRIYGQFTTNNTSAVDSSTIEGSVTSVTRAGVGDFDIVLKGTWNDVIWADAKIYDTATTADVVAETVATDGGLTIQVHDAGTATDTTGKVVQFVLDVRHTGAARKA